ncbi:MAG: hypothetical protein R3E82_11825 [Pseudomonadales bacterium]|nr:hypothetical protein [Pseudomonadales bacterium]
MIHAEYRSAQRPRTRSARGWRLCIRILGAPLVILALAACSGTPLEPPPRSFDLGGDWVLDASASTTPAGPPPESLRPRRGDLATRFLAQDFPVLFAERMQIEQNRDSMGIDFGQGAYRDISWGERDRGPWRVQAGWREGQLHVYSRTHDASSRELYSLSPDGQRLTIDIEVDNAGRRQSFTRVFTRRSPI